MLIPKLDRCEDGIEWMVWSEWVVEEGLEGGGR